MVIKIWNEVHQIFFHIIRNERRTYINMFSSIKKINATVIAAAMLEKCTALHGDYFKYDRSIDAKFLIIKDFQA